MSQPPTLLTVQPATTDAYEAYIRAVEAEPQNGEFPFLWSARSAELAERVRKGDTMVARWPDPASREIPEALLHDWVGAVWVPGGTIANTLCVLQDYDNHKKTYHPDVAESKVLGRKGDHFNIYLRLVKRKIITVVVDTWHSAQYGKVDAVKGYCRSRTTRVCEIENPGSPAEMARLPGTGYGFLWGLYSHWKFEEQSGGVTIECRAISLTRDIPSGLSWMLGPMLNKLPAEALKATLQSTRRALVQTPVRRHDTEGLKN